MRGALYIFSHPGLEIAVGRSHTSLEPQVRIEVKGEHVRISLPEAKQMIKDLEYWIRCAESTWPAPRQPSSGESK